MERPLCRWPVPRRGTGHLCVAGHLAIGFRGPRLFPKKIPFTLTDLPLPSHSFLNSMAPLPQPTRLGPPHLFSLAPNARSGRRGERLRLAAFWDVPSDSSCARLSPDGPRLPPPSRAAASPGMGFSFPRPRLRARETWPAFAPSPPAAKNQPPPPIPSPPSSSRRCPCSTAPLQSGSTHCPRWASLWPSPWEGARQAQGRPRCGGWRGSRARPSP